jgi:hypothetical protein
MGWAEWIHCLITRVNVFYGLLRIRDAQKPSTCLSCLNVDMFFSGASKQISCFHGIKVSIRETEADFLVNRSENMINI